MNGHDSMGIENKTSHLMINIDNYLAGLYRNIPLTYLNIYKNILTNYTRDEITSILDLGCGDGSFIEGLDLNGKTQITGVDIYKPYLVAAKKRGVYKKLIRTNILQFDPEVKFDIILMSQVLEHFEKSTGMKLLERFEKKAKKLIIVSAPNGEMPQDAYDNNKYQIHKSVWTVNDMKQLGYNVIPHGFKYIFGGRNVVLRFGFLSYFIFLISWLMYPLLWLKPELGTYMICTKKLKN